MIFDLPQVRPFRVSQAGDQRRGKLLLLRVVLGGGVVVELPRERDAVLGGAELLLQLADVAGRLELRIALHRHQQPGQGARQRVLRLADLFDRFRTRRVDLDRLIARLDHRFECRALEVHRAFDGVDEIGNQIVAALELHVDLFEGVDRLVLE